MVFWVPGRSRNVPFGAAVQLLLGEAEDDGIAGETTSKVIGLKMLGERLSDQSSKSLSCCDEFRTNGVSGGRGGCRA